MFWGRVCTSRRKNGGSNLDVKGEAGLQKMAEEQSAAEVKGVVDYNHLTVYITVASIIRFYYSVCSTRLGGTRVLSQGLG